MRNDNSYFYGTWGKMHTRCYDPEYHSYHRYGGRGIIVCPEWHSYPQFKAQMFDSWFRGATLDRQDNDGNYEPSNCRWLSKGENSKPQIYDINWIKERVAEGLRQKDIAVLLGTDQAYISRLLKRGAIRGI